MDRLEDVLLYNDGRYVVEWISYKGGGCAKCFFKDCKHGETRHPIRRVCLRNHAEHIGYWVKV